MAEVHLKDFRRVFDEALREALMEKAAGGQYGWRDWWPPDDIPSTTVVDDFRAQLVRVSEDGEEWLREVKVQAHSEEAGAKQEIKRQIIAVVNGAE